MKENINMEYLDKLFRFRSIDGKNNSFSAALQYNNSHFYINPATSEHEVLPYVYGGGQVTYTVPTSFRCQELPFFMLLHNRTGNAKFFYEDTSLLLPDNSLLLLSPQSSFEFQGSSVPFCMNLFFIDGEELYTYLHILSSREDDTFYVKNHCSLFCQSTLEQMQQLLKYPKTHTDLFLSKCIRDIFCDITYAYDMPEFASFPDYIKQCKQFLEEEYMQPITLDLLQEQLDINKYRLCREFSEYMHISPMQYLLQIRIDKSKELLAQTDMTIHEVGDCIGIPNTTPFINQFRKLNAVTPLQYRKSVSHTL